MGWNGSTNVRVVAKSPATDTTRANAARRLSLFVVAGCVLAVAFVVILHFSVNHPHPQELTKQETEVTKSIVVKKHVVKSLPRPKELSEEEKEQLVHRGMVKSDMGVWQPTNRPWRAGRRKVHDVHTNGLKRAKNQMPYRNATEQLLFQTFSRPLGSAPLPFAKLPQRDMENLANILLNDNQINDSDSDELAVGKDIVNKAKEELRKYLRGGGDVDTFFEYYHHQLELAYSKRRAAQQETLRIASEERDPDLARRFQEEINKKLVDDGIMPLKLSISDDPDEN